MIQLEIMPTQIRLIKFTFKHVLHEMVHATRRIENPQFAVIFRVKLLDPKQQPQEITHHLGGRDPEAHPKDE